MGNNYSYCVNNNSTVSNEVKSQQTTKCPTKDPTDYELVYKFSVLSDNEKEKLVSMLKAFIEKEHNDTRNTSLNQTSIVIPKYFLVNKKRYFNIGAAFLNTFVRYDRWEHKHNDFVTDVSGNKTELVVDNCELYDIILKEVLKYHPYPATIGFNTAYSCHGNSYKCGTYYNDENEASSLIYGRIPSCYNNYKNAFPAISISVLKIFNYNVSETTKTITTTPSAPLKGLIDEPM